VDDDAIVRRLSSRWICPNCHTPYSTVNNPPRQAGVCDRCGTKLVQREDDREETVRERLQVYHENNVDLLGHYRDNGLLRQVPGQGGIEEIYQRILRAVNGR